MKKNIYLYLIVSVVIIFSLLLFFPDFRSFLSAQLTPTFKIPVVFDTTPPVISDINIVYNPNTKIVSISAKVVDLESGVKSVIAIIEDTTHGSITMYSLSGDDIYTGAENVSDLSPGIYDVTISALDNSGNQGFGYGTFTIPTPISSSVNVDYDCHNSKVTITATLNGGEDVAHINAIIQDGYPTGNIKGAMPMTQQSDSYVATFNVWNYTLGDYFVYISIEDVLGIVTNNLDPTWKFTIIDCGAVPPIGDLDPPTITNPNVSFDCDTEEATSTATITDASGISEAFVIIKNSDAINPEDSIVSIEKMTKQGTSNVYEQITDTIGYNPDAYDVYISAIDNSPNQNNSIVYAGYFATKYALDLFTANPTTAYSGKTVGTLIDLMAHISCPDSKTTGETIFFTDDTDSSVKIGTATLGFDGYANFSDWRIDTYIKGDHTLRATHQTNLDKDIPYSTLTTKLGVETPVCSYANGGTSGFKVCVYVSIIENSSQLDNFTITAAGVTYTKEEYEADPDFSSFRAGFVRSGATTGPKVDLSVHLNNTRLCPNIYPLSECTSTYDVSEETVTFIDQTDDVILGTAITNSSGVATLSYYPPASQVVGKHTIIAMYGGSIEKGFKPSYKDNYLNEGASACSYANGGTSGTRICVFLSYINSGLMDSFTITPTDVIAGAASTGYSAGTEVTFRVSLSGVSNETITFIDETQEYTINKWFRGYGYGVDNCDYFNMDFRQSVVVGTAKTDSSGIATLYYRFPYSAYIPGNNFGMSISGTSPVVYGLGMDPCQYNFLYVPFGEKSWPPQLLPEKSGEHRILAVYSGSINNDLQASWIAKTLNLTVPGTCSWFPNSAYKLHTIMQNQFGPAYGYGEYSCSKVSQRKGP